MKSKFKQFVADALEFLSLFFTYPRATFRWMWAHRAEPNNRAKRRRMQRDVRKGLL